MYTLRALPRPPEKRELSKSYRLQAGFGSSRHFLAFELLGQSNELMTLGLSLAGSVNLSMIEYRFDSCLRSHYEKLLDEIRDMENRTNCLTSRRHEKREEDKGTSMRNGRQSAMRK